jgi:hypothetical protein
MWLSCLRVGRCVAWPVARRVGMWRSRVGAVESFEAWRPVWGVVMESIPLDALDRIGEQLTFLNLMLFAYLVCKGVGYASSIFARRDPPKKSIRSELARSNES